METGDGQMNELFDRFLPLLERYLPFEPTATYLITRKLLTRKEYFQLKEEEGKEVYRNGNFVKRLVDVVAGKGPDAFARFFSALEFCVEDSDDSHLGLEYLIGEIKRYLEENGLLHVVAEVDYEERDGGSRSLTSRCSMRTSYKYSQRSAESLLSKETGYNSEWSLRGSLQHVDSDLVQRHATGFAEQAKVAMQRLTEQIAGSFTEQMLFLQKKLDDANECKERNIRIRCELEEENERLKKDKEELGSQLNASLAALVRVETECSNLKQQVENLRIRTKSPDTTPIFSRQISTSSVHSSSSDLSTEGFYYASVSNVDTIVPSNDYLYSKEVPSVIFEDQLGEMKKDFSKKKCRLCNIFPRRCKSFNEKKRCFPFYKLRKVCSIPSTISSHNVVKSLSPTSAQAQSTSTTSSDRVPNILMVSTV